jgi:hypothetical protein
MPAEKGNTWRPEMTKNSMRNMATLHNYLFKKRMKPGDLSWVKPNLKKIEDHIERGPINYALNSKIAFYTSLIGVFRDGEQPPENKELWEKYNKIMVAYKKQSEAVEDHQKLDEKEARDWLSFREILEMRRQAKANIRDWHSYRTWFVFSLYTLQPPIHSEYKNMKIISQPEDWRRVDRNYYYIPDEESEDKQHLIIIQKDKTSHKKGTSVIGVEPAMQKLMEESLKLYPREYVIGTEPLTTRGFQAVLDRNVGVGINRFRSAYITNYYQPPTTIAEKKKIAYKMRHDYKTAEQKYFKILPPGTKDVSRVEPEEVEKPKASVSQPPTEARVFPPAKISEPKPARERTFKRQEYAKAYREKKKSEIQKYMKEYQEKNKDKVLRAKIIWELNTANTKNPKPESIKKYNLKYNEERKRWE